MFGWIVRPPWWVVGLAAVAGYMAGRNALRGPVHPDLALRSGMLLLQRHRRVLALGARPGELEREVGGTLWRLKQAGATVVVATLLPSAGQGRQNPDEVARRELEQAQAVMGYDRVHLVAAPTGPEGMVNTVRRLGELWAEEAPDLVLAPGGRQDRTGAILHQAALTVADQRGEAGRLAFYATDQPNVLIDISRALEQKWAGLRAYPSALPGPDPTHQWLLTRKAARYGGGVPAKSVEGLYRL